MKLPNKLERVLLNNIALIYCKHFFNFRQFSAYENTEHSKEKKEGSLYEIWKIHKNIKKKKFFLFSKYLIPKFFSTLIFGHGWNEIIHVTLHSAILHLKILL